jgi:hypothetical protein
MFGFQHLNSWSNILLSWERCHWAFASCGIEMTYREEVPEVDDGEQTDFLCAFGGGGASTDFWMQPA